MTFSANGESLLSVDREGVRVWRVKDGEQMTTMRAVDVKCLAVSKDGRWIAAGTGRGEVLVWDAKTYEEVFWHERGGFINGVDFSPDSTRLVSASDDCTATIWEIATRDRVQTLDHGKHLVTTTKYSPQGNRIATATHDAVRVWNSNNGRLLVHIKVAVTPWYNTGLLWLNNYLFVVSDSTIEQFEASTGSAVSGWPVPDLINLSCIALPKHCKFIAFSSRRTVIFWDTATHTQLGLIQHPQDIHSIALSSDSLLAIGEQGGKITINSLSRITVSILFRWIVVHTNDFLAPIIFSIQSPRLVHTPHSRHQTFRSMTLRSTLGSTVNSQTRKHY